MILFAKQAQKANVWKPIREGVGGMNWGTGIDKHTIDTMYKIDN